MRFRSTRSARGVTTGKVLIADEDHRQRRELVSCLVRTGIDVAECAYGGEVLDVAARELPHIVILDINLPGAQGDELAAELARRHPRMKILLTAGDPERCAEVTMAHLPVFAVLEKPIPLRALVRFISTALANGRYG